MLGGRSVWYSNDEAIPDDLEKAFTAISEKQWEQFSREEFVHDLARLFPRVWKVHPFREGNTRTVVMMMTLFVEHYGYYMDHELMAASAGYVRDSFVMASLNQISEYEHLERILMDAVCTEPIIYDEQTLDSGGQSERTEKYQKYQKEKHVPQPHQQRGKS